MITQRIQVAWEDRVVRPLRTHRRAFSGVELAGPVVGYLGYVGYDNFGDDVLYTTITRRLCSSLNWRLADLNRFPRSIFRRFPGLHDLVAIAVGGGTLIYRGGYLALAELALEEGIPLVIAGSGVADTQYWTSVLRGYDADNLVERWNRVLRSARHVGLRGPKSSAMVAASGGPHARVVGDPALYVSRQTPFDRPRTGVVGINLGSHDQPWGDQQQVISMLAYAVKHLLQLGLTVKFIAMNGIDVKNAKILAGQIGNGQMSIHTAFDDEDATLAAVRDCDLMIGQRLHAIVLACAYGVPCISLSYQPKAIDFLESLDLLELSMRTDSLELSALIAMAESLLGDDSERVRLQLSKSVQHYHGIQEGFFAEVCKSVATLR
jgi:polysaccharide pyruvyl transferase WcaK-like protein